MCVCVCGAVLNAFLWWFLFDSVILRYADGTNGAKQIAELWKYAAVRISTGAIWKLNNSLHLEKPP